ncbi:hypothetical protein V1224_07200 [Lachnospiraceae bacterium JLR.KK008]
MMQKSVSGYRRYRIRLPIVFKAVVWALISAYALMDLGPVRYKFFLSIVMILFLESLRVKRSKALYVFLALSTVSIAFFWSFFEGGFLSSDCQMAIFRVWLLLLAGNAFLYSVSLEEVVAFLFRVRCPVRMIAATAIVLNASDYFMEAFAQIRYGYELRNLSANIFTKYGRILQTQCIDFLFLLVECKKIYMIHEKQIEKALCSMRDDLTEGG